MVGWSRVLHVPQDLLDRSSELHRPQSRNDSTLRSHEKRIIEPVAQPRQHAAYRRLRQPQPVRGARDAAFVQERVQRLEQVEVQRLDITHSYICDP